MLLFSARKSIQGFTLIEMLIIIAVIGILAAISAPSFLAWLNKKQVDDALVTLQGALQEAQREAIRKSNSCEVELDTTDNEVTSADGCLVTGDRTFKSDVRMVPNETSFEFSYRGTITLSDAGTVVFLNEDNPSYKKCLVISSPLGIVRTGNYTGQVSSDVNNSISSEDCEKQL